MDEESLRKQMNAKKAKEQAEKLHKVSAMKLSIFVQKRDQTLRI